MAQVIYNRLHAHHTLEFDSTVNYPLDRREVATSDADRAQKTPWNTYVSQGLPADRDLFARGRRAARRRASRSPVTGCTSSPSTLRAPRCSPGTTSSIWPTSSWLSTTVSSTARPASAAPSPKAAVLGSPIAHSKSPQLHLAAYRALGLDDWTYDRIECDAEQLPGVVGGFGPEWVGVSVTMPGKFAALRFADERTDRARRVGSANTLVRTPTGWRADNTDIDGVAGALGSASGRALVCGSGGTAPAAVVGLAQLGVAGITVVARNPDKAARLVDLGSASRRGDPVLRPGRRRAGRRGGRRRGAGQHHPGGRGRALRRHLRTHPGAAGRRLRPVAHAAGRRGRAPRAAG